ncbi:hypothetical protein V1523DRAFT_419540 [Lipomyces doorenjongii]
MKALSTVFPTAMNQLCRWHTMDQFDAFMKCITQIASSLDREDQDNMLAQLQTHYPAEASNYFLAQWCTTSRVEGSHGAMKGALTSSSGSLCTVANKINRKGRDRAEQLSILSSNENLRVRL